MYLSKVYEDEVEDYDLGSNEAEMHLWLTFIVALPISSSLSRLTGLRSQEAGGKQQWRASWGRKRR